MIPLIDQISEADHKLARREIFQKIKISRILSGDNPGGDMKVEIESLKRIAKHRCIVSIIHDISKTFYNAN